MAFSDSTADEARAILDRESSWREDEMAAIEVHVSQGGRIVGGELQTDAATVARCTICARETEAVASLGDGAFGCAPCLRERLDALSVARFRLRESRTGALPWGKVTG